MGSAPIPRPGVCLGLIVVGFVLFVLGFALFAPDVHNDFSTAGMNNRVAIASALGTACVEVAIMGLAASLLRSPVSRTRFFNLAMAVVCGVNCLAVSGIGFFWGDAASQQNAIFRLVAANAHSMPNGSELLLDGFCTYSGPAWVFESYDDESAAIRLALGSPSFLGGFISRDGHFTDTAYETMPMRFDYGNHLFVYNVRQRYLVALPSKQSAMTYLQTVNPRGDSGCPAGQDGVGVKIF